MKNSNWLVFTGTAALGLVVGAPYIAPVYDACIANRPQDASAFWPVACAGTTSASFFYGAIGIAAVAGLVTLVVRRLTK
jgi:fructose-specific phosphotransferase system IIC component